MLNRIQKAYRTAIDTYRLTRFRQKTENTAFGLARKYGIELSDAVYIHDHAGEDANGVVVIMRTTGLTAQEAHYGLRRARGVSIAFMNGQARTTDLCVAVSLAHRDGIHMDEALRRAMETQ